MTGGELELVREVIESNYLNDGDVTERFERAVADRVGSKHAVAVTSGTTAITLALMAAGVRAGDEVVVPDMTFIATANAVRLAGGTPVLADVDDRTLNLDPAALERAITPRTRAVVPVHVSGRAADMAAILKVARKHDIAVVEDAAEAFISRVDGRALGTPFVIPVNSLVIFTIVAIIAGVLAAVAPARRASKLNVLNALHYE